jgi:hypothetical protein
VRGSAADKSPAEWDRVELFRPTAALRIGQSGLLWDNCFRWADALHGLANGDGVSTGDNMVGYFVEFTPPTPVPAALQLFATGLGVLGWRRKRKAV